MAAIRGFSLAKINKISIIFSVLDTRITSTREFLRRVTCTKVQDTNPKCIVTSEIRGDNTQPQVHIVFNDGSDLNIDPVNKTALDLISDIKSRTLTIK